MLLRDQDVGPLPDGSLTLLLRVITIALWEITKARYHVTAKMRKAIGPKVCLSRDIYAKLKT